MDYANSSHVTVYQRVRGAAANIEQSISVPKVIKDAMVLLTVAAIWGCVLFVCLQGVGA